MLMLFPGFGIGPENPYPARLPLPSLQGNVPLAVVCQGNVPLAVVCNKTKFHASVGHFWEEAPEGHVHVSGNDTAAASATFRQIVVQVEDSDKRVHAIQYGLVPLDLDRQDATPSSSLFSFVRVVPREPCDSMCQSKDCAASVQWRSNPTVHEFFLCEALRRELHAFWAVCFFPLLDFLHH